ncbi:MAG TPA: hypothetical protein VKP59_01520 [Candidatus Thermoplasmatota archaeon]|nr:hypothetical protein [Candidatus Thermoplasmatota archaeon]
MKRKYSPALNMIKPDSFVKNERDKTKLNWFCYEMSMSFYDDINEKLGKSLQRYRINDLEIARFSIHCSKEMKPIILEKLSGKIDKVYFSYELVESYFPHLGGRMINKLLKIISKSWYDQLGFCIHCPTRCISEKDMYCTMFDSEDF